MPLLPTQLNGLVEFKVSIAVGVENVDDAGIWAPDANEGLWDVAVWNASEPYWIDITDRALAVSTNRGRDRWEQRFRTGTAATSLNNQDGVLSLDTGQLGSLGLRPGRWFKLEGRVPTRTGWVSLYVGQIDSMADKYTPAAAGINSNWQLLDWFARWAIDDPPALETPVGAGELTSDRVNRIFEILEWPAALQSVQTGFNTMQATTLPASRLEEIMTAADAEDGAFFVDRNGIGRFKNRDWLQDDLTSANVQWAAGRPGDHIEVLGAATDWSTDRVQNDIRVARAGGTEYRVTSAESETLYGARTFQRYDYENDVQAAIVDIADRRLARLQWDKARLESISVYPLDDIGAELLLNTEVGWRVLVRIQTLPGWTYTGEYYVNRVQHSVDTDDWTVSLRLDDTSLAPPLGVSSFDDGFSDGFL